MTDAILATNPLCSYWNKDPRNPCQDLLASSVRNVLWFVVYKCLFVRVSVCMCVPVSLSLGLNRKTNNDGENKPAGSIKTRKLATCYLIYSQQIYKSIAYAWQTHTLWQTQLLQHLQQLVLQVWAGSPGAARQQIKHSVNHMTYWRLLQQIGVTIWRHYKRRQRRQRGRETRRNSDKTQHTHPHTLTHTHSKQIELKLKQTMANREEQVGEGIVWGSRGASQPLPVLMRPCLLVVVFVDIFFLPSPVANFVWHYCSCKPAKSDSATHEARSMSWAIAKLNYAKEIEIITRERVVVVVDARKIYFICINH